MGAAENRVIVSETILPYLVEGTVVRVFPDGVCLERLVSAQAGVQTASRRARRPFVTVVHSVFLEELYGKDASYMIGAYVPLPVSQQLSLPKDWSPAWTLDGRLLSQDEQSAVIAHAPTLAGAGFADYTVPERPECWKLFLSGCIIS